MEIKPKENLKPIPPVQTAPPPTGQNVSAPTQQPRPTTPTSAMPNLPPPPRKPLPWGGIIVGIVALLLIVLGWASFGTINIAPTPDADSITINGKKVEIGTKKRLPGTLNVKIEKNGYLTYEKKLRLNFHGTLNINPQLKEIPVAKEVADKAIGPLTAAASVGGVKAISSDKQFLTWARPKKGNETSIETLNLNYEALPDIQSVQYPTDQRFALLQRSGEIGILDFASTDATSQDYETFGTDIRSIALSDNGDEVFYWQYSPDVKKNFLVRQSISRDRTDRYFDQPLIDQLGLTNPILRWSHDNKYVLAIERKIVLIDIINRQAKIITYDKDISDAWITPDNKKIVAITAEGKLITVDTSAAETANNNAESGTESTTTQTSSTTTSSNTSEQAPSPYKVTEHDITTSSNRFILQDNSTALLLTSDNKLISYNFDEKAQISYLLDEALPAATIKTMAADFKGKKIYFLIDDKIYEQPLVEAEYDN